MSPADLPARPCADLADLLRRRAAEQPGERAYVALSDRGMAEAAVSFGDLYIRAAALARCIAAAVDPGDRALILCPSGVDFMIGFFGCILAGVVAVPMMPPRRQSARDASAGIVADCTPRLAIAPQALIDGGRGDVVGRFGDAGLVWLAPDEPVQGEAEPLSVPPRPGGDALAFLQYTSGSTSAPKGVMVTHANLLANLEMIRLACGNTRASTYVSWVPLYHDMGLILNALQALYLGATCILLAPVAFLQRPHLWLRAISEYRAEIAGGPNFAFDLCVDRVRPEQIAGIDLSSWKLAFVGAEPVRASTLERFAAAFRPYGFAGNAIWPGYGMAEATLLASGGCRGAGPRVREVSRAGLLHHRIETPFDRSDAQALVGCGRALAGERIAIVDPESRVRLGGGRIGEVWVAGPNVAAGYWRNAEATAPAFGARIAGESEDVWLRTGDLGFLDEDGDLFLTGRIKEIIIIRGVNHYPQDIERTVQGCDPALRRDAGAAFAVAGTAGERLVVVQEVERTQRNRIDSDEIVARIREAIVNEHDIVPYEIALLRPGSLPKTTSGKIQRSRSRQFWLEGSLDRL